MRILIDLEEASRVYLLTAPFISIHVNDLSAVSTIGYQSASENYTFNDTHVIFDLNDNPLKSIRLVLHDGENRLDWDAKQVNYGTCNLAIQEWLCECKNTDISCALPDDLDKTSGVKYSWRAPSILANCISCRNLPDHRLPLDCNPVNYNTKYNMDLESADTYVQLYVDGLKVINGRTCLNKNSEAGNPIFDEQIIFNFEEHKTNTSKLLRVPSLRFVICSFSLIREYYVSELVILLPPIGYNSKYLTDSPKWLPLKGMKGEAKFNAELSFEDPLLYDGDKDSFYAFEQFTSEKLKSRIREEDENLSVMNILNFRLLSGSLKRLFVACANKKDEVNSLLDEEDMSIYIPCLREMLNKIGPSWGWNKEFGNSIHHNIFDSCSPFTTFRKVKNKILEYEANNTERELVLEHSKIYAISLIFKIFKNDFKNEFSKSNVITLALLNIFLEKINCCYLLPKAVVELFDKKIKVTKSSLLTWLEFESEMNTLYLRKVRNQYDKFRIRLNKIKAERESILNNLVYKNFKNRMLAQAKIISYSENAIDARLNRQMNILKCISFKSKSTFCIKESEKEKGHQAAFILVSSILSVCEEQNSYYEDLDFPLLTNNLKLSINGKATENKIHQLCNDLTSYIKISKEPRTHSSYSIFADAVMLRPRDSFIGNGQTPMLFRESHSLSSAVGTNETNQYFIQALNIFAAVKKVIIYKLFLQVYPKGSTTAGIYTCIFYEDGLQHYIIIDERLPFKNNKLICSRNTESSELWTALIEKAYSKFIGGYEKLSKISTFETILTHFSGYHTKVLKHDEKELNFYAIANHLKYGNIIYLTTADLIKNHYFVILDAQIYESEELFRIFDPTDSIDFNGKYSIESSAFLTNKDALKSLFKVIGDNDFESFGVDFNDSTFLVTYQELLNVFSVFGVLTCNHEEQELIKNRFAFSPIKKDDLVISGKSGAEDEEKDDEKEEEKEDKFKHLINVKKNFRKLTSPRHIDLVSTRNRTFMKCQSNRMKSYFKRINDVSHLCNVEDELPSPIKEKDVEKVDNNIVISKVVNNIIPHSSLPSPTMSNNQERDIESNSLSLDVDQTTTSSIPLSTIPLSTTFGRVVEGNLKQVFEDNIYICCMNEETAKLETLGGVLVVSESDKKYSLNFLFSSSESSLITNKKLPLKEIINLFKFYTPLAIKRHLSPNEKHLDSRIMQWLNDGRPPERDVLIRWICTKLFIDIKQNLGVVNELIEVKDSIDVMNFYSFLEESKDTSLKEKRKKIKSLPPLNSPLKRRKVKKEKKEEILEKVKITKVEDGKEEAKKNKNADTIVITKVEVEDGKEEAKKNKNADTIVITKVEDGKEEIIKNTNANSIIKTKIYGKEEASMENKKTE